MANSITSGSRLAQVASQRRRQRKLAAKTNESSSAASQGGSQKENKNKADQIQVGLAYAPTQSSTFDDSTITSGTWSLQSGQSTITEDTFNFSPPVLVTSNPSSKYKSRLAATTKTTADDKPTSVVTTPRRRNVHASYHAKLKSGETAVPSFQATPPTAEAPTTKTQESTGSNNPAPTPKNNNLSSRNSKTPRTRLRRNFGGTVTLASSSVASNDSNTVVSSATNSLELQQRIKLLTDERDKLRDDMRIFKRKLQTSTEAKNRVTKEKDEEIDDIVDQLETVARELSLSKKKSQTATISAGETADQVSDLEEQVEDLTKQLSHCKSQVKSAELDTRKAEEKLDEATESGSVHTNRSNDLQVKLDETTEELDKMLQLTEELTSERINVEQSMKENDRELRREFREMKDEKDRMESNWKECKERLDRMKSEQEDKYSQHVENAEQLEQTIYELKNARRESFSETRRKLSTAEIDLANTISDKREIEKSLNDQISDLKNELQMQRNTSDTVKRHHAQIVEGLKSDLAKARQLREESASSLQRDMETMKIEYDENMKYYKDEVESLRSQLRNTKQRADSDRMEWMNNLQPTYERQLESVTKEKDSFAQQLAHANNDIECLKTVRDKDIEMLESELDKTYKVKVEMEVEFKDTKRQLQNALRSLEEMVVDGGRMRTDLEGVMNGFSKEKQHYQNESNQFQSANAQQKGQMEELKREKDRFEESCLELRSSVQTLEDKLMKEADNVQKLEDKLIKEMNQHRKKDTDEGKDVLVLEIQYLKNKLEKAEEVIESSSALAVSREQKLASTNQIEISELKALVSQLQSEKHQLQSQLAPHDNLLHNQRDTSADLSRAQQTIQILKSKERYLESRVESLANQISKTVQDYEMKISGVGLSLSASSSSDCSTLLNKREMAMMGRGDSGEH